MLKKEHRITRNEFKGLVKPQKMVSGSFFTVRFFLQKSSEKSKFAISISKKQEKKAVNRNRVRRIAFKVIQDTLPTIKLGIAAHFILKRSVSGNLETLKHDITNDIQKLLLQL